MQNRVLNYLARSCAPELWVVRGSWGCIVVSRDVALTLMEVMRRRFRPRWIRFQDLVGSEICVRTNSIEFIAQNSAEQRAVDRALRARLDAEENGGDDYPDFQTI